MNAGDLIQVSKNYDFVTSYVEDVEVYTIHPSMDIHDMSEIMEVKLNSIGILTEVYAASSGTTVWAKVLFPEVHGWIDL